MLRGKVAALNINLILILIEAVSLYKRLSQKD